jgi:hypothetical protein
MPHLPLTVETTLLETCMEESRMTQLAIVTVMSTGIEAIGDGEE